MALPPLGRILRPAENAQSPQLFCLEAATDEAQASCKRIFFAKASAKAARPSA